MSRTRRRDVRGYAHARLNELASPEARATGVPLSQWAIQRIRLDGKPFSFAGHEYLRGLYDDTSPHVVVIKAAQLGVTTWAILRSLHACLSGLTVLYYFPTKTDVLDFSRSRVNPLIETNPFLARAIRETDTAGLKRIGDAYLYLRGMQSTVGMKSVPADMVVFDELDEATPDAKTLARERLSHSDYRRMVELSNPSLPGYGIDEAFQESDQRHWMLKCPSCGKWTAPDRDFPTKLGEEVRIILPGEDGSYFLACPRCQAALDITQGEWVADYPDRTIHGYRISQLISSKVDPGEILREYQRTRHAERFYNLKIGLAWADAQNVLSASAVLALCGAHSIAEKSEAACTMGVDTGRQLHVVISRWNGESRRVVYLGVLQEFSQLDDLMERFQVSKCVIDALPETHATRAFAGRFRGRVWMNYFNESQKGAYRWDEKEYVVQENRTEALDASRKAIRDGLVVLPRRSPLVEELAAHLAANAKRLHEDPETGSQVYRYIRTGADHFSLAFTYDCIAWSGEPAGGSHALAMIGYLTEEEIEDADEMSAVKIMRMEF
jgi:uncharacterized C2H2 Zn-finger protein